MQNCICRLLVLTWWFFFSCVAEEFEQGDKVKLHGLKNATLNGQSVTLEAFSESERTWIVRLEDGTRREVRPKNIRSVEEVGDGTDGSEEDGEEWNAIENAAEWGAGDHVSVYYGEYLLARWILQHSPWNAYHSGVAFINNNTGERSLVDYSPKNTSSVANMIFPKISMKWDELWTWLTGDIDVVWNNGAAVRYYDYWPKSYTKTTYLGDINGSIYNRYLDWVKKDFRPTHVTFEPTEVVIPTKGPDAGVPSRMCHDLVSDTLWVLYNMGAVFKVKQYIFRDHIIFYSDGFEYVDYDDFFVKRGLLRYFRAFQIHLSKIKQQFTYAREMIIIAWKMGISPYTYAEKRYIRINVVEPFLNYCYLPLAIPPKHMDLLNDQKLCALPMAANITNQTIATGMFESSVLAHLISAEARLDKPVVGWCFLLTSVLVLLGSFRTHGAKDEEMERSDAEDKEPEETSPEPSAQDDSAASCEEQDE